MPNPDDPTLSISPVDALIAEYLQSVEAGNVPNRPELLAQHPDHAENSKLECGSPENGQYGDDPIRLGERAGKSRKAIPK